MVNHVVDFPPMDFMIRAGWYEFTALRAADAGLAGLVVDRIVLLNRHFPFLLQM